MSPSSVDLGLLFGANSGYVEELYALYKDDPALVGDTWANYFIKLDNELVANGEHRQISENGHQVTTTKVTNGHSSFQSPVPSIGEVTRENIKSVVDNRLQDKVYRLINTFRSFGHLKARINPLSKGVMSLPQSEDLDPMFFGFTDSDMESEVSCDGFQSKSRMELRTLIEELRRVYCGSVGFEFNHLLSEEERNWLQSRIESRFAHGYGLSTDLKLRKLKVLVEAETFEAELHKKYVGHKRFSLEGGETLLPVLDTALDEASQRGVKEAVLGMAHRGRLNVLVHTAGKPLEDVFNEFEDQSIYSALGSGDVKYHLGYESIFNGSRGQELKVSLACNPSHLEFVDPVLEGMVRAKQDLKYDGERLSVLPILMHGDAAVIGQGVVYETLNLSQVGGYRTGGTLHIVINNQIGFTTNPEESRSSVYCTDMAKGFQIPIFHVNAEDVEAACWVTRLALEFRQRYQRDVFVDIYCWRKYGHNEGDDPSFTQPLSYSEIKSKPSLAKTYSLKLKEEGIIDQSGIDRYYTEYKQRFENAQNRKIPKVQGEACPVHGRLRVPTPDTGVEKKVLERVASTLLDYPENFVIHPKLKQILEKRVLSLTEGSGIDWGFAEALAYGSLMLQGVNIRLSGQDSGRGTFSHRHLALNNYEKPETYLPLSQLEEQVGVGCFEVYNSTLSEAGVLGFEYGYSLDAKKSLVLWEGQFGDFANGAQVHIDQFIASGEAKWHQLSGVVMLLPHGYEGQGPEHSSARLERFLQLCGEGNMVVCYPSTAAQNFHLLRRQGVMEIKRPLVVMTPKSLLRLPDATSKINELVSGRFETVLEDDIGTKDKEAHVVMVAGKIYYDLIGELRKSPKGRIKVLRIEQLYPFPQFEIKKLLKDIKIKSIIWAQEEPQNMGAWSYIEPYIRGKLESSPIYVGRAVAASPATGSGKAHAREQSTIVREVLAHVSS